MLKETEFINLLFTRFSALRKSAKGGGLYPKKDIFLIINACKECIHLYGEKENICELVEENYLHILAETTSKPQPQTAPTPMQPQPTTPQKIYSENAVSLFLFLDKFSDFIKYQSSTYLNKSLFIRIEREIKEKALNENFYVNIKIFDFTKFREQIN